MMDLHEDVIADLLPLYFSGDASEATRSLVDAYFERHPAFAATMRAAMADSPLVPGQAPENGGVRTIRRVRSQLKWRAALIAIAIFFSLMPFSFVYDGHRLAYFMWRDAPASAAVHACIAVLAWATLWAVARRTDKT